MECDEFAKFVELHPNIGFWFVNDGSTDGTQQILEALRVRNTSAFRILSLSVNSGKAEAVRRGILLALDEGVPYVGYWDADLATPLNAIPRFVEVFRANCHVDLVTGARVQLLGREIVRKASRHYLGRIFATVVSTMLDLAVYDTQCGAKLFRATTWLKEIFETPFVASWVFDVEILARMRLVRRKRRLGSIEGAVYEHPLRRWVDVQGSKVGPEAYLTAAWDLVRIYTTYFRFENREHDAVTDADIVDASTAIPHQCQNSQPTHVQQGADRRSFTTQRGSPEIPEV